MFEKFKSNIADKFGFKNNNNNNTNNTNPLLKPNFKTTPLSQNNSNLKPKSQLAPTPTQSPAEVLYGEETKKQKQKEQKRNSLLNELGDSLTPAQVLYSDIDELETLKQEKRQSVIDNANYLGKFSKEDKTSDKEEFETETNDNNDDEKEQNNKTQDSDFSPEDDLTDENETNEEANEEDDEEEDLNTQEDLLSNGKESIDNNDKNKDEDEGFDAEMAEDNKIEESETFEENNKDEEMQKNNSIQETDSYVSEVNNNSQDIQTKNNKKSASSKDIKSNNFDQNGNYIDEVKDMLKGGVRYTKKDLKNRAAGIKFEKDVNIKNALLQMNNIPFDIGKIGTSLYAGADGGAMYSLANGKKLPLYTKDAIEVKNINDEYIKKYDSSVSKWKPYIEQKIKAQFKDFGYKLEDVKGYIFKSNSAQVKRIKASDDFKNILRKNQDALLNNEKFSGEFKRRTADRFQNGRINNLYYAFHNVDFLNNGLDKKGNLHLYMFDTYDFNENSKNSLIEAARRQMLNGKIKGYFTLHEIILTQKELKEILK